MSAWYDEWFNSPWYTRLYGNRGELEAQEAVHLVRDIAHLERGARVLDLCCGYGRHTYALCEAGYHVTGLDNSTALIAMATERYDHPHARYVVGDMRGPYPGAPFDAVVNFFTSFGYFDDHGENERVFHEVHDTLRPGGVFMIDFFNAEYVRAYLVEETVNILDGVTIEQHRRIDEPFVRKSIEVNIPCGPQQTFDERVWLYDHIELERMLTRAGLHVRHRFGEYDGSPFDHTTSSRCILFAQR
jgi:SAM-dependent methyltransferase